jgi:hypothetical protein
MSQNHCGLADELSIDIHLNTEMELLSNHDSLLHHCEQLQKRFPAMRNFYNRDRSDYVLEEGRDAGAFGCDPIGFSNATGSAVTSTTLLDSASGN